MIFNKSKTMQEITKTSISEEHYNLVEQWKAIYKGYYKEFHEMKYHTLNGERKRTMRSLNMGKVACEVLAKIIFTEKVEINISDKTYNDNIEATLKENRFNKVFQNKIELMLALGGLVLKVSPKPSREVGKTKLVVTYVTPDCFIPMTWENDDITEGVFLNISRDKNKVYCLFEFHKWNGLKYTIKNELYESEKGVEGQQAIRVPLNTLYEGLEEQVTIEGLTLPLFTYIKPNIANNFDLQTPLGISIFANSLDTLYAIDVAFDSFIREFSLGRRRILVPATSVRSVVDPQSGELSRYFDANDEVYQAFNHTDPDKQKIQDNTVGLRVVEHVKAINALLEIYCMQLGFSAGTFTFDGQSVKTATEVISEQSATFQTKQANENLVEEGLDKFIRSLGEVAELYNVFNQPAKDYEIEFQWDDSIIQDRDADSDFFLKLKNANLIDGKHALMEILNFTEEQADEMLARVNKEMQMQMPDLNDISDMDKKLGKAEVKDGDDE